MRHNTLKNRFGRTTSHREAMIRNMVTNLFRHERMETTIPKAKEVRRHAEKVITLGKRVTLGRLNGAKADEKAKLAAERVHAIRLAGQVVQDKEVLTKLFDELATRYESRNGGYTRILRKGSRLGDGTEVGILELVDRPERTQTELAGKGKAKQKAKSDEKPKRPRSERKAAAPKAPTAGPKPSQAPKGGGFDASRGRGGSRGS